MKKVLFSLFTLLLALSTTQAQDADKAFKTAKKTWNKYVVATDGKDDILMEAKEKIDAAIEGISAFEAKELPKVWSMKGQIYNELALNDARNKILDPAFEMKVPAAAMHAYQAYKMLMDVAQKKYQKGEAIEGIVAATSNLSNMGRWAYGSANYSDAFQAFSAVLEAREIAKANKNDDILATDEELHEHQFMTGLSAYQAGSTDEALKICEKLKMTDYKEPAIYEMLFSIYDKNGDENALSVLEEGRAKYPDDEGLRVKEINHYLKLEKLDELVGKLKSAIEQTPDNTSLYLTLGYVYDNLFQREEEAGNAAKSKENFDNAMDYYNQALKKEPASQAALYSVGALYYNKAAMMTKDLVDLEGDYSKKGIQKYDEKKKEVFAAFDDALPFFIKAEKIDPNDVGTINALKEIYARKDQLDMSNEFKKRLQTIQDGGKVESYFATNE